ncbi:MAG: hypothetical protein U0M06_05125 [Clostridia bacterium]|nr:hypothetical protein [Clostridia bacterium]
MNREKHIREMSDIIYENRPIKDIWNEEADSIAENLYNAGYRKQIEGEWEKQVFIIFDSEKVGYRCSECNTTWDTPTHYCPNCGAKMKGGAE